ncbi:flippase [Halalkalicoccus ordinarius]|uniref:flippase n=1 Tax=Halalkalicoccus ordinarius TaxID=3116651 RepID=UPI00300EBD46
MGASSDDLSKLLSSAVLVFAGAIISSIATLAERVAVGRLLSPSAYGEFSIALAVFTLGSTIGAAGLQQGVPRFMARFTDSSDIRGAWLTGVCISLMMSLAIAGILILGSPVLIPRLFETTDAEPMFYMFVLAIPLYVMFAIGVAAVRGMENTRYKVLTEDLGYPLIRIGLIVLFLLSGISLFGTGVAYVVALAAMAFLVYFYLNRLFSLRGEFHLHIREMAMFSFPLIVSTIMTILLTRTDTLMLGYFRTSAETGIYNAAYPLANSLTVILSAFGYMYLPVASRVDKDDDGSVEDVYSITTKWIFMAAFPAFVILLVFPSQIISIIFGSEYGAGGAALSVLALGFFTNAAVGRNRETLSALGATNFILISNLVAFSVNICLNLILIPRYGFIGAAVASAVSFIALNVVVYLFLLHKFDITPFSYHSTRVFISLPVIFIPSGFLMKYILPTSVLSMVLTGVLIGVLSIMTVALIGGFESGDIALIDIIEEKMGVEIPFLRNYIPDEDSTTRKEQD